MAAHQEPERLYSEIGKLKVELDWLKKVLDQPAMTRHSWIAPEVTVAVARQCVLAGVDRSFIVCPHSQNTNGFLYGKNFVHDTVLNIDAARICTGKIANQLLEGRRILKWIVSKHR